MKNGDGMGVYWVAQDVQVHGYYKAKTAAKQAEAEQPREDNQQPQHQQARTAVGGRAHDRASLHHGPCVLP